jgi:rhodanese-related sulfurtransferase
VIAWLMGLKTVTPAALHQRMQHGSVAVFDVNARGSWLKARVPGARNLDPLEFKDADLPADKRAELVFYCSNPMCRKAPNAARRAKQMGYENAQVMSAGITGWLASNLPVQSGE